MSWKIGLSSCGKVINEELMRQYAENGIEVMELSLPYDAYEDADYPYFKKVADDAGVEIRSIHLPYKPEDRIGPSNPDEAIFRSTLEIYKRLIEKAAFLGCKVIVMHTCRGPVAPCNRPRWIAQAQRTLSILAEFAAQFGMRIAVENQPRNALIGSSADLLEVLKADDRLGVCFDVNHLMRERDSHENFMKTCGDKIVTVHISDYDFLDERHWLPGEGAIDWQMIVNGLKKVGYNGPWVYELGFDSETSINRPRLLTCADFKRNAEEIFAGKKLTVIGEPVSGLVHWTEL